MTAPFSSEPQKQPTLGLVARGRARENANRIRQPASTPGRLLCPGFRRIVHFLLNVRENLAIAKPALCIQPCKNLLHVMTTTLQPCAGQTAGVITALARKFNIQHVEHGLDLGEGQWQSCKSSFALLLPPLRFHSLLRFVHGIRSTGITLAVSGAGP